MDRVPKNLQWINTPVLMEALIRYQQGHLNRPMKLWVEEVLEINQENCEISSNKIF